MNSLKSYNKKRTSACRT